jgi:hypothetical protein
MLHQQGITYVRTGCSRGTRPTRQQVQ